MTEKRLPTAAVLLSALTMILFGVAVGISALMPHEDETQLNRRYQPTEVIINDRTAEGVAESFYDCWRKRRWEQALTIAVGPARNAVLQKQEREREMESEERALALRAWQALARSPLRLVLDESEDLEDGTIALRGIANYRFAGEPYAREVEFITVSLDEGYRVQRMNLGQVLTDLPSVLEESPPSTDGNETSSDSHASERTAD